MKNTQPGSAGPFAPLAMLMLLSTLPFAASAQTISSGAPAVANVPVDSPLALGALLVAVALAGWWSLRRSHGVRRVASLLLVAAVVGLAGQGAGLMAQVVSAFTQPAGETLPITVSPITAGGFTGFQPADFSNNSGAALRIAAIDPPDLAQCFATNPANTLLPPGPPTPSPHPACGVGAMLANGATCRVDVEAICRSLYVSGATLTAISPNSGTASGGVGVTLTGTGLTGATSITFDGVPATSVNVVNATTITAVTPAHAAGAVNVAVFTPAGAAQLASGYTYLTAAALTSVSPGSGTELGGTSVTLTGAELTGATSVTFGGVPATSFTVNSATSITAVTPAHAVGAVDVVVTTPAGAASLVNGYTYLTAVVPSTVTAISPSSGTASGGVGVTLTGTGLTGATSVTFDGVPATSVNVVNATTITAVTPAHAAGVVDVVVTTPSGAAQLTNGYIYLATAVGQSSGGGVIAVLDGGLSNLIAATADNSTGIDWGGMGVAVGASAQSNTDGAGNTATIEAILGAGVYAAQMCSAYEVDSQGNTPCQVGNTCYNDWFLPARNQLASLFINRAAVGGFANGTYWSSTESPDVLRFNAWGYEFSGGGGISAEVRSMSLRARCVRAFTP